MIRKDRTRKRAERTCRVGGRASAEVGSEGLRSEGGPSDVESVGGVGSSGMRGGGESRGGGGIEGFDTLGDDDNEGGPNQHTHADGGNQAELGLGKGEGEGE